MYIANHLNKGGEIYAATEMIYAVGALAAGIWINRLLQAKHTLKAIIILMFLTVFVYLLCSFTKTTYILLTTSVVLGLTNAGTRILRITYLFHHIPNHIIGRTGSVFQAINVLFRLFLILLFSMPFFAKDSNITWAYFICGIFVFLCTLPLLFFYKQLRVNEKN
jgi:MFS family permease